MKYPDMDSYIRQLKSSRGLTLQDLSRMLGYSSQTSLTRLMQQAANRASLQQFADRLHACTALQLTREESNQLDDLIELHDIGQDFSTMVALRRFLRGESVAYGDKLTLYSTQGSMSFLAHFASRKLTRMLLINSEQVPMYNDLALLLEQGNFEAEHWFYSSGNSMHTVNCLRGTIPVLYSPHYRSYTFPIRFDPSRIARGLITSDILFYEFVKGEGELCCEAMVFTTPYHAEVIPIPCAYDRLSRLLPPKDLMQPVRMHVSSSNLIEYIGFCAELERDRTVCRIKPDPGIEQIPLHILKKSIVDHAPPEVVAAVGLLEEVFHYRQQNMLDKSEHQYHIYRKSATEHFVQTGRLSDHPWCCRPFTLQERVEILRYIRHTLMTKETFHLHFLKDDDALRCDEIVLYEGRGLSVIKPDTDYAMEHAHAEILITQPDFLKVFKRFFMESTLRYRAGSREDAASYLDSLISYCEAELRDFDHSINKS